MPRYLLCPQCGSHRMFVTRPSGEQVFFYVDSERSPVPTEASRADLSGLDFSTVSCCGCSWSGSLRKLVTIFQA